MPQYYIGAQHQYRITHLHQINCGAVRIKMNFNEKKGMKNHTFDWATVNKKGDEGTEEENLQT